MALDMIVFALMAMRYKYVEKDDDSEGYDMSDTKPKPEGVDNNGYTKSVDDF